MIRRSAVGSSPDPVDAARFDRDGFIGPIASGASAELVDIVRAELLDVVREVRANPVYGHTPVGRFSVRDWHLVSPALLRLMSLPAVVRCLSALAGSELTLWRSKIFCTRPGAQGIGWHQEWGYFTGEEIGNARPSLQPADPSREWNWSVWFALDDMSAELAPLRFAPGTHRRRIPWTLVPMTESAFFEDPFVHLTDAASVVERARANTLCRDIDTAGLFDGVDPSTLTLADARAIVEGHLSHQMAKTTEFDPAPEAVVTFDTIKRGEFIVFSERTMHGSLPNRTDRTRIAVNARYTLSSTLVYPQRERGETLDGSNLDIRHHANVVVSGDTRHPRNRYSDALTRVEGLDR